MNRFHGIIGIGLILGLAVLCSNNRRRINLRLVFSGLALQRGIALLVFRVPPVHGFFERLGHGMARLEAFAKQGANFVYDGIAAVDFSGKTQSYGAPTSFVFAFNITATIILICILTGIFYHLGIMQRIVAGLAWIMKRLMQVSGAEALSNVASAFVGQVEAQVLIRPYLRSMTRSELLASMSGSLACIAGGVMIIYMNMGIRAGQNIAPQLIAASLMAAPGALVIAKIVLPETESPETLGGVKLKAESPYSNLLDAISQTAMDGFRIAMNMIAILIGFIALIALLDWLLLHIGHWLSADLDLSLTWIFGKLFYPVAWAMGVPQEDLTNAAGLLGQKIAVNEFVAFSNMTGGKLPILSQKGITIVTVAICGFANFASVGMQIGGIGALVPERRADLARLGMRALLCGTLASYMSGAIAGIVG